MMFLTNHISNWVFLRWLLALSLLSSANAFAATDCVEASRILKQLEGSAVTAKDDDRLKEYDKAIEYCPKMAEAHYNKGVYLLRVMEVDSAIDAYKAAIAIRENWRFSSALATAFLEKGDDQQAEKNFEEAIRLGGKDPSIYQGLSIIRRRNEDFNEALEMLRKAENLDGGNIITLFNTAAVYELQGDIDSAIVYYQKTLEQAPEHVPALLHLGLALQKRGRAGESISPLKRAALSNTQNPQIFRGLGLAYEQLGDLDLAEEMLRKAVVLDQGNAQSLINLGIVLIRKEQPGLAKEFLLNAIESDSKNAKAYNALGWAEIELGRYEDAEETLSKAIEINPRYAEARNNLGVLYQRLGKIERAKEEFSVALQLDPSLKEARSNLEMMK